MPDPIDALGARPLSRRPFLRGLAGAAGGMGLAGMTPLLGRAQECIALPLAGPTVQFTPDATLPVRRRKSAHELTAAEIERLRVAYAALRQLSRTDPGDPRGWVAQAEVHCRFCSGGETEIHKSWFFLPWHRAFLYFHERILAALIGDPSFALPLWDWDAGDRRQIPSPYLLPAAPSNSLWDGLRRKKLGTGAPRFEVGGLAMRRILGLAAFEDFGGTAMEPGRLEKGPHDLVHDWVGMTQPDMGRFTTAARDPVFYPHHAQVDRLWDAWTRAGHENPSDARWLDQRWVFCDADKRLVSIAVRNLLDIETSLRYTYRPAAPEGSPRATDTPASRPPKRAPSAAPACPALGLELPGPLLLERARPTTVTLGLPAACRVHALRIDGISLPPSESIVMRLFVDLPGAGPATDVEAARAHYLGYFCIAAQAGEGSAHAHASRPFGLSFPIPDEMAPLFARPRAERAIRLTFVPVADEEAPPQRALVRLGALSWLGRAA